MEKAIIASMTAIVMMLVMVQMVQAVQPTPPAPEPVPPPEPPPEAKTTLYGVVADQATGGALQGVLVTLDAVYSGITDSDGRYEITDIEPGSYTLKFEKTGYGPAVVNVTLSEGTVRVDAGLAEEAPPPEAETTLYGVVSDRETGGVLGDVAVTLDTVYSGTTDLSGRYEITGIEPGSYTLRFEREGYGPAAVEVTLPEGSVRIDATLVQTAAEPFAFSNVSAQLVVFTDAPSFYTIVFHCTVTNPNNVSVTKNLKLMRGGAIYGELARGRRTLTLAPGQSYSYSYNGNTYDPAGDYYYGPFIGRGTHCFWLEDEDGNKSPEECVSR